MGEGKVRRKVATASSWRPVFSGWQEAVRTHAVAQLGFLKGKRKKTLGVEVKNQ